MGCTVSRRATTSRPPSDGISQPANAEAGAPEGAICERDALKVGLRSRFWVKLEGAQGNGATQGVLLMKPGEGLRVKLFGFAGLTILDASWTPKGDAVVGQVKTLRSSSGKGDAIVTSQIPTDPEAALSFVLWALWQPRCVLAPRPSADRPGWWHLSPNSAHAIEREVLIEENEVRQERQVFQSEKGRHVVQVRYEDYGGTLAGIRLPSTVRLEDGQTELRAEVRIVEVEVDPDLPADLFRLSDVRPREPERQI
jgi:hypothetical protein